MLEHLKLEGGAVRPDMVSVRAGEGFDRVASLMQDLAVGLGEALLGRQFATAAE